MIQLILMITLYCIAKCAEDIHLPGTIKQDAGALRGRGHGFPGRRNVLRGAGHDPEAGRLHPPVRPEKRSGFGTGNLRRTDGTEGLFLFAVHRLPDQYRLKPSLLLLFRIIHS